jgi:hypothetical protein
MYGHITVNLTMIKMHYDGDFDNLDKMATFYFGEFKRASMVLVLELTRSNSPNYRSPSCLGCQHRHRVTSS